MVFSIRGTIQKKQQLVNCNEAFNMFDLLGAKYFIIEQLNFWENVAHDLDLRVILEVFKNDMYKDAGVLEKMMRKFSVKGIDTPPKGVHTATNTEVIYDELIAKQLFIQEQEYVEMFLRAIRTSTTNDDVRQQFTNEVMSGIKRLDRIIKYLKLKGWINQPPLYPNTPPDTPEGLDSGEAYHLWDHLTFRYDNIETTQRFYGVTHDGDFKLMIKKGLQDVLKEQATLLEKECLYFGLPLPKGPTNVVISVENTEFMDDDHIYRLIFSGMQGATVFHAQAVKQSVTNDRVRKIFKQLLIEEIDIVDKFIILGKMKGWLHVPPQYKL